MYRTKMNKPSDDLRVVAETPYLNLVARGNWTFATRPNASGVVIVVPLTNDGNLLFVQQHRPPVNSQVVEFPAGLAGDISGSEDEAMEQAARRELREETGYEAGEMQHVFTGPASAGLTDETFTMFLARDLNKTGPGGGDESENIVLHEVPAASVNDWLKKKMQQGCQVGCRVWVGLYFLQHADEFRS